MAENKTLPPGWQEEKLGDICTIRRGGSPRPIQNYLTTSKQGINWLRIGDVNPQSKYIFKTKEKIKEEGVKKSVLVTEGDFILSNSMSYGRPYIMKTTSCVHDGWLILSNIKKIVNQEYLYYALSAHKIQNSFKSISAGSGVRNLKKESVASVQFMLPPLHEQKAIALLLEKWDTAIEKTQDLITAKEKQLKALYQQYFQPNISKKKNWQLHKIGEFVRERKEASIPTKETPLYSLTIEHGITPKTERYNREFLVKDRKAKAYKVAHPKDIAFNPSNLRWGAIARSEISTKVLISPIYAVLEVNNDAIDNDFLTHAITCPRQIAIFATKTEGTLIERMAVKADIFQMFEILVPSSRKEQRSISRILNLAKKEIQIAKQLAEKYQKQRQILLQNLLSGKWRIGGKEKK